MNGQDNRVGNLEDRLRIKEFIIVPVFDKKKHKKPANTNSISMNIGLMLAGKL